MPRTETTDVGITPLDLSIAKGARCLGVSSRLSTNSISRFESHRVCTAGARWISDRGWLLWLLLRHLCDGCGMMNPMAQTRPMSEELRAELKDLRSTATRLIEQASCLTERCAELEDLIARGTPKPHEIMTIAHHPSTRACELRVWRVR